MSRTILIKSLLEKKLNQAPSNSIFTFFYFNKKKKKNITKKKKKLKKFDFKIFLLKF